MIFSEYPFLRYVIFLTLGILIYPAVTHFNSLFWVFGLGLSFTIYFLLFLLNEKKRSYGFKLGIPFLAMVQLVLLGLLLAQRNDIDQDPQHLNNFENSILAYTARVSGQDEPKPNSIANRIHLDEVFTEGGWKSIKGEVLIYHRSQFPLQVGDFILVKGSPQVIQGPTAPFEFDYKNFMRRQKISHQHFIGENFQVLGKVNDQPINSFFIRIRSAMMNRLDSKIQHQQAIQVAKALLLGQKKDLEKQISDAYATAGAMHILAVSGLHVGIIYGFFFLFIKPYRLKITNRILYLSFIILLIWGYAMLTGMSPSVMRAATMFTLMALAQMKSRSPSIFNAIALSAFILLVFDPNLIYAVGFQLSYTALLGILLFQPVLVRLWTPKNAILEYVWQISTVGVAAQLATFPISAYYFHSFPVYFILSNLVAIPGAFVIMCFGIPFLLLAEVPLLSDVLAWLTEKAVLLVNSSVFWIQELPFSRVNEIYIPGIAIFFYWAITAMVFMTLLYRKPISTYFAVALLFSFLVLRLQKRIEEQRANTLVFYGIPKGYALDFWIGKDLYYADHGQETDLTYKVFPYRNAANPEKKYAWPVLVNDTLQRMVLPAGYGHIDIDKERIFLGGLSSNHSYIWEKGKWQPVTISDSISLGQKTYKFVF